MKNPISVSTGLVYKFHNSQSDRIQRMRELNLQGMELCISDANEVLSFNPSPEIVSYLRSLKRLTIHAPWINIKYNDNAFCRMVLKKIELLCELLGVENVIIHSSWTEDYTLFKEYKFHVLLENEDYKFGEMGFPNRIESILNANPDIGFNFDFAHALTLWASVVRTFIDRLGYRMVQVHISHLSREIKDHNFLYRDASEETLKLLAYFRDQITVPLVLECVAQTQEEINGITEEINFLKKF